MYLDTESKREGTVLEYAPSPCVQGLFLSRGEWNFASRDRRLWKAVR